MVGWLGMAAPRPPPASKPTRATMAPLPIPHRLKPLGGGHLVAADARACKGSGEMLTVTVAMSKCSQGSSPRKNRGVRNDSRGVGEKVHAF